MVVFCPNIGVLSTVVLALVPLLRPFAWQSLLLPVLPVQERLLEIIEAPVPFVLGVQARAPAAMPHPSWCIADGAGTSGATVPLV